MDYTEKHKEETAKLINTTDNSGAIYFNGTPSENKMKLLKRLKEVDEQYTAFINSIT